MTIYPYVWSWRKYPVDQDRHGQRCRVVARSRRMNSALVEFEDGWKMITSRNGIRKNKEETT